MFFSSFFDPLADGLAIYRVSGHFLYPPSPLGPADHSQFLPVGEAASGRSMSIRIASFHLLANRHGSLLSARANRKAASAHVGRRAFLRGPDLAWPGLFVSTAGRSMVVVGGSSHFAGFARCRRFRVARANVSTSSDGPIFPSTVKLTLKVSLLLIEDEGR